MQLSTSMTSINIGKGWVAKVRAHTHSCDVRLHTCVCVRNYITNKHERDFVLQVRCWDLNNSCDKISTLRGTKAVTNIILGFFGGNIWELSLIVYIFGNSYEILWILWELSVIVYILKFSWLFAFPNQLIVII